ncbi:CRISP/Allergen/PR-1-like [Amblyomma americanum]
MSSEQVRLKMGLARCVLFLVLVALNAPAAEGRIAASGGQNDGECESIYLRYNQDHVMCRQHTSTCQPIAAGIEDSDKDKILAAHNRYRSQIATGNTTRLPPAANMMELEWDDDLARVAQAHANLCANQPSCSSCMRIEKFPIVGRTGCLIRTDNEDNNRDWEGCIGHMFDESGRLPDTGLISPIRTARGAESFTQLAWATTWRVGCGYVKYPSYSALRYEKLYTCAYGPGGNIRGEDVYKVGRPCSECPEGTCCGSSCRRYGIVQPYEGLCKTTGDGPSPTLEEDDLVLSCLFNRATSRFCRYRSEPADGFTTKNFFARGVVESVLQSGQSAEMTLEQPVRSTSGPLCVEAEYSKGPNVAGQPDRGLFNLVVTPVNRPERQRTINLSGGSTSVVVMRITLNYDVPVQIGFSFVVPGGSQAQYVNIHKVAIYEKACSE